MAPKPLRRVCSGKQATGAPATLFTVQTGSLSHRWGEGKGHPRPGQVTINPKREAYGV